MKARDENGAGLSPFAPDFDRIRRVRACSSATIADLVRAADLDPATDFRFADWSSVDWRGTDVSEYDFTGAVYSLPERPELSMHAEVLDQPVADAADDRDRGYGTRMGRVVMGIQPTGSLHLGNYVGAIRPWVELQDESECFIFLATLHAITVYNDPAELAADVREMAASLIACGLNPERVVLFDQAHVPAHAELAWILNCTARFGWLGRMPQFMKKNGRTQEGASVGLFTYPVLQAADVLLYQATHVPVGGDQLQHLELIRDIAAKFNVDFAEVFSLPQPLINANAARLMSLQDGASRMSKMAKSDKSRINLTDSPDQIARKIRKARTDPDPLPDSPAGLEGRAEVKNLVNIYAALAGETVQDVLSRFAGQGFGVFKPALSEMAIETLRPIGIRMAELLDDQAGLDAILARGSQTAATVAAPTIDAAYRAVGLRR